MRRAGTIAMLVTGALLVAGGLAHALAGWPAVRQELVDARVDGELFSDVRVGWLYGSAAMLTFGALTLMASRALGSGSLTAVHVVWPISAIYLLFGTAAYLATSFAPHFLG